MLKLCDLFPKTAAVLQNYAIQQLRHLDEVRRRKEHLHPSNYVNQSYRKKEMFFDRKANVDTPMGIDVQSLTNLQKQDAIERHVNQVCGKVEEIEDSIYTNM